jgi:hypothetical protein
MTQAQRQAFDAVLEAASLQTFEYGTLDCASFAIRAYEAITGKTSPVSVTWRNEAEAIETLSSMGGIHAAFTSALGEPLPVKECVRGDILLADLGDVQAVGVHDGARMLAVAGPGIRGLKAVPWAAVQCGWGVV